jgi:hypothetical protein
MGIMNRRTLLQTIAALPLCGWVRPKRLHQLEWPWKLDTTAFEQGLERAKQQMESFSKAAMTINEARKLRALEAQEQNPCQTKRTTHQEHHRARVRMGLAAVQDQLLSRTPAVR